MAIIIKEKENTAFTIFLIIGSIVLVMGAIIFYYLFIIPPLPADLDANPGFDAASTFARASFDINLIINSPVMELLKDESLIPPPIIEITNLKTNLFESF